MHADTEDEVISVLKREGFWENPKVWPYYGNRETNFNTIGNQQSRPDAALVEKIVNCVDARLMDECLVRGIDPEGPSAPKTIHEAVAKFFENNEKPMSANAGRVRNWTKTQRTSVAEGITVAATGATAKEGNPCFTIADCGEGQTPQRMPHTLLSLDKSNKLHIPFVQGKFNMGGTGVLKFCGRHNLQLILSRRDPRIENNSDISKDLWGFTIVRREDPDGNRRNSVYTYLAPLGADKMPGHGGVLRFDTETMPIFPNGQNAYSRESKWGTLIKLYEFATTGFTKSHIVFSRGGLLSRLDILIPDAALPFRLYECREYKGHGGSFETTLAGLCVRLGDDSDENLESGFPSSSSIRVSSEEMIATIYAFKKGVSETYRKNEGIIFVVNGQTHGRFTQDFFKRRAVGLSYLADSILVVVDCSKISGRAREDLFMNSRDRLSGGELEAGIERALEDLLKTHEGLRALKERRRREEIETRLDDSKPLEDILKSILKQSPALSALFLHGQRLATPFKTTNVMSTDKPFVGKRFPTYFKFKGKDYGSELHRNCSINMRCRIAFETDAVSDYFSRASDTGIFSLWTYKGNTGQRVQDYALNLQNGIATLSLDMPAEAKVGDSYIYDAEVIDSSRLEPFKNRFVIEVMKESKVGPGKGKRQEPPSNTKGQDREAPHGIQLPNIISVYQEDWEKHTPHYDKYSALRIINAGQNNGEENPEEQSVYDFYVNMDNIYLNSELKITKEDPEITRARFKYGMVLMGLALLQQDSQAKKKESEDGNTQSENGLDMGIEGKIEGFSKAVAPVLVPMIISLGALDQDSNGLIGGFGEDM